MIIGIRLRDRVRLTALKLWRKPAVRILVLTAASLITVALLLAGIVGHRYWRAAQSIDLRVIEEMSQASLVYDVKGNVIHRYFTENRILLPGRVVPARLAQAIVATEDRRFYEHSGVDLIAVLRAIWINSSGTGPLQGASTITQQLARNSIGRLDRTFDRKLLEIFLSWRIERAYAKDEILRFYLDRIYFGNGMYGVETAALAFFGKTCAELNLSETALLAGIISGPNLYSPRIHPVGAIEARNRTLRRMQQANFITKSERRNSSQDPLALASLPERDGSYDIDLVQEELDRILPGQDLSVSGYEIRTTLDEALQNSAQDELDSLLSKATNSATPLQGALMVSQPGNGAIRAIIGGRSEPGKRFNRAYHMRRPAGNTLAPLLLAAAMQEKNISPLTWIEAPADTTNTTKSSPLLNTNTLNKKSARAAQKSAKKAPPRTSTLRDITLPDNAERDGTNDHPVVNNPIPTAQPAASSRRHIRAADALTAAGQEQLVRIASPERWFTYAQQLGLKTLQTTNDATVRVDSSISPAELCSAFAALANEGLWNQLYVISEIRDSQGLLIYKNEPRTFVVFSPDTAYQALHVLPLQAPVAVSVTNTLNHKRHTVSTNELTYFTFASAPSTTQDQWLLASHASLTAALWLGPDNASLPSSTSAIALPSAFPLAQKIFTTAVQLGYPTALPTLPPSLTAVTVTDSLFTASSPGTNAPLSRTFFLRDEQLWQANAASPEAEEIRRTTQSSPTAEPEPEKPRRSFWQKIFGWK